MPVNEHHRRNSSAPRKAYQLYYPQPGGRIGTPAPRAAAQSTECYTPRSPPHSQVERPQTLLPNDKPAANHASAYITTPLNLNHLKHNINLLGHARMNNIPA